MVVIAVVYTQVVNRPRRKRDVIYNIHGVPIVIDWAAVPVAPGKVWTPPAEKLDVPGLEWTEDDNLVPNVELTI